MRWHWWQRIRLTRFHIDLVIDDDADLGALCQLHRLRADRLRIHHSGQRHLVLGHIGIDAEICGFEAFVGIEFGLNRFFQRFICRCWTACARRRRRGVRLRASWLVGSATSKERNSGAHRKNNEKKYCSTHEDLLPDDLVVEQGKKYAEGAPWLPRYSLAGIPRQRASASRIVASHRRNEGGDDVCKFGTRHPGALCGLRPPKT